MLPPPVEPAASQRQRLFGIVIVGIARGTLVERHHDVRPDDALRIHHILGRKEVFRAVDVRTEVRPLFGELATVRQREDLEAAAIGENGTLPPVELVQPAGLVQDIEARAQVQVIGVAQDYLGLDVVAQLALMHSLDRRHRAHGHEDRRQYRTVVGRDYAGPGMATLIGMYQLKIHRLSFQFEYSGAPPQEASPTCIAHRARQVAIFQVTKIVQAKGKIKFISVLPGRISAGPHRPGRKRRRKDGVSFPAW